MRLACACRPTSATGSRGSASPSHPSVPRCAPRCGPSYRLHRPQRPLPRPSKMRQMMEGTVATQFETIAAAAQGCDAIVGATALQIAARSVAEQDGNPLRVRRLLPRQFCHRHSTRHRRCARWDRRQRPPRLTTASSGPRTHDAGTTHGAPRSIPIGHRWAWPRSSDVRSYIFTDRPWLAADPTLAPWPDPADEAVFQTGAWILTDERPLSPSWRRSSTLASRRSTSVSAASACRRSSVR